MKRSNRVFQSLLIAFAMLNIAMLLLFFIFFSHSKRSMNAQLQQSTLVNLEQSTNVVSFITEYIQSTVGAIHSDHSVMRMTRKNGLENASALNSGIMAFDRIRYSFPAVYSLYLYNKEQNTVITSGSNEYSSINDLESFSDRDSIQNVFIPDSEIQKLVPYARIIPLLLPNGDLSEVPVYTFYSFVTYLNKEISDLIVINIEAEWINDFVAQFNLSYSDIYVVTDTNEIFGKNIKPETRDLLEDILGKLSESSDKETSMMKIGGIRYFVARMSPDDWRFKDWRFLYIADYDLLSGPLRRLQFITVAISLILVLGSCFLSFFYSRKNIFKPVTNLYNRISYLENFAEENKDASKHLLIKSLLFGDYEQNQGILLKKMTEQNVTLNLFEKQYVFLVVFSKISIDNTESYGKLVSRLSLILKRIYQKDSDSVIETISINQGRIIAIYQDRDFDERNFIEKSNQLHSELLQRIGLDVTVILSSEGYDFKSLPFLYSEVVDAREYLYLSRKTTVLLCRDIDERAECEFRHSLENDKKLISSIFTGNREHCQEIFDEMENTLRTTSPMFIRNYLAHLVYEIISRLKKETISAGSVEYDEVVMRLQSCDYYEESTKVIRNLIDEIMEGINRRKKHKREEFVEKVKDLIEKNYADQTFCMDVLSRELHMSTAYIGKVFYKAFGMYFTEYLRDYRLESSLTLLTETDENAIKIAEKVGFGSSTYYFKLFRERFNQTPKMYRENNKNES